ncbi:MAG TPA: hypothetical protein VFL70_11175 [Bacteroidia bacterium]|nr:hypothetical protein [Bacteroidia bacterium]
MLNRIFSILFIPLILISSSGGVVFMERCAMSKLPSYSLIEGKKCCCSQSQHDQCCKETKIVIKKIEDDYSSSVSANIPLIQSFQFTLPTPPSISLFDMAVSKRILTFDHAPPNTSTSLSVKYRRLLI